MLWMVCPAATASPPTHSHTHPPHRHLAGTSGGSAISPEGFRFNICEDEGRCQVEPMDGTSRWYRRMWQVRPGGRCNFNMGIATQPGPR